LGGAEWVVLVVRGRRPRPGPAGRGHGSRLSMIPGGSVSCDAEARRSAPGRRPEHSGPDPLPRRGVLARPPGRPGPIRMVCPDASPCVSLTATLFRGRGVKRFRRVRGRVPERHPVLCHVTATPARGKVVAWMAMGRGFQQFPKPGSCRRTVCVGLVRRLVAWRLAMGVSCCLH